LNLPYLTHTQANDSPVFLNKFPNVPQFVVQSCKQKFCGQHEKSFVGDLKSFAGDLKSFAGSIKSFVGISDFPVKETHQLSPYFQCGGC
jgi:hypothetical protein